MSGESVKYEILEALVARLQKITTANGYNTDVKKVYYNKIPMGIDLSAYELPAIFVVGKTDSPAREFTVNDSTWFILLSLWHKAEATDQLMHRFVRDINKVLYSDSPTSPGVSKFRIHPRVVQLQKGLIEEDMNMIEANRVFEYQLEIRYRTPVNEL